MTREEIIRRIHEDLQQLPDDYLTIVRETVERLRAQLTNDNTLKRSDQPEAPPFVDEIERVREQSGRGAGRMDDQTLA